MGRGSPGSFCTPTGASRADASPADPASLSGLGPPRSATSPPATSVTRKGNNALRRVAGAAAVVLAAATAAPVAADHGYWPAYNVTPAEVTGHEEATEATTQASYWGARCFEGKAGGPVDQGALDTYGAILTDDYELAVIGIAAEAANYVDPEFLEGPNGLTIFESPRKGEFLWADADGNGRFANEHEADATLLILCPVLPATDTAEGTPHGAPIPWLAGMAVVILSVLASRSFWQRTDRRAA